MITFKRFCMRTATLFYYSKLIAIAIFFVFWYCKSIRGQATCLIASRISRCQKGMLSVMPHTRTRPDKASRITTTCQLPPMRDHQMLLESSPAQPRPSNVPAIDHGNNDCPVPLFEREERVHLRRLVLLAYEILAKDLLEPPWNPRGRSGRSGFREGRARWRRSTTKVGLGYFRNDIENLCHLRQSRERHASGTTHACQTILISGISLDPKLAVSRLTRPHRSRMRAE
jgi:hypothetical protein